MTSITSPTVQNRQAWQQPQANPTKVLTLPSSKKSPHSRLNTLSDLVATERYHFGAQLAQIKRVQFGERGGIEASVPVVDLANLANATTEEQKNAFAKEFGTKLQKYGFIALKNHGVKKELFNAHYNAINEVLSNDREYLKRHQIDEVAKRVGYYPTGEIKPDANGEYKAPDPKHMWQTGNNHNVYPARNPEFRELNYQLFQEMKGVGDKLVDVLARFLGDKTGVLSDFIYSGEFPKQASMMRSIQYPKLNAKEKADTRTVQHNGETKWVRTGEHRDIGLFTLLPEATDSGLQLLPNNAGNDTKTIQGVLKETNEWMDVFSQEGYLILNTGDALSLMTESLTDKDGKSLHIPSTWHRVVGNENTVTRDRFSVPFFFDGNWLNTMPDFATGGAVTREEAPYDGVPYNPALRMLWSRYAKSGTASIPFEEYAENYKKMGETVRRVLAERNLDTAYHAGI